MKLIELKCKNCGATLNVPADAKVIDCEFCHTSFAVEDAYSEAYNKTKGVLDAQMKASEEFLNKFNTPGTKFVKFFISIVAVLVIGCVTFIIFWGINDSRNFNNEFDLHQFNDYFESRAGTQSMFFLEGVFDEINTNNKTNKEHIIFVKYNDIYTSDTKEITDIKHSLDDNKKYEVSYEYDDNGYINVVIIEDID